MGVLITDAAERPSSGRRPVVLAAAVFAAPTAFDPAVAARENVERAPFGVRPPISVRTGLLVGRGCHLSAPWPMTVVALIAALRGGPRAGRICAVIGAGVIVGTAIEPVTKALHDAPEPHRHDRQRWSPGPGLIGEGWRASQPEAG
jgi:hypothetical protein